MKKVFINKPKTVVNNKSIVLEQNKNMNTISTCTKDIGIFRSLFISDSINSANTDPLKIPVLSTNEIVNGNEPILIKNGIKIMNNNKDDDSSVLTKKDVLDILDTRFFKFRQLEKKIENLENLITQLHEKFDVLGRLENILTETEEKQELSNENNVTEEKQELSNENNVTEEKQELSNENDKQLESINKNNICVEKQELSNENNVTEEKQELSNENNEQIISENQNNTMEISTANYTLINTTSDETNPISIKMGKKGRRKNKI